MKKKILIERSDFNVYSVKNDPISFRLMELLDFCELKYKFFDFRDYPPTDEQLIRWAQFEDEEYPVNTRNTVFKKTQKNFFKLDEKDRPDWLRKNYHVISRPIIENFAEEVLCIGGRPERIIKNISGIELN